MIDRELLIQELHAADTAQCSNPPALAERAPFIREYYERLVHIVEEHIRQAKPEVVWNGVCQTCNRACTYETGGRKICKWFACTGYVYPRLTTTR